MKANKILPLLLGTGMIFGTFVMRGQSVVTDKGLTYSNLSKVRSESGKDLSVGFSVAAPKGALKSQQVIIVHPTLVSRDGKRRASLKSFAMAGKRRYLLIRRSAKLHNKVNLPEADTLIGDRMMTTFQNILPFERWMADATVEMNEQVFGCAECPSEMLASNVKFPSVELFSRKDYRFDFIEPANVVQKRLEDTFESKVNFELAKSVLKKDFGKNAYELHRLEDFVTKSLSREGTELDTVTVAGYASPEGYYDFNITLSDNRAKVLAQYVKSKYPRLAKNVYMTVKGYGEDWDGLKKSLQNAEVSYADEVINLIDKTKDPDKRKVDLKNLKGGEIYRNMLQAFYPQLRRTVFKLGYKVRFFEDDELLRQYNKDPRLLSNKELFRLAQELTARNEDPVKVYEDAYKLYSDDIAAALNYANALLKYRTGQSEHVLAILEPFKEDPRCDMPRAIAENELGHYDVVEEILQK